MHTDNTTKIILVFIKQIMNNLHRGDIPIIYIYKESLRRLSDNN